ncbi:nucleoside-diphosphate kinase [Dactylosporangium sp. AC04546]|uniref:nucleoside-diphosphate kinase n=1 Tax=Dactylosporangium sp. AC04546 TaxID=2862460 RepID=UPI001EDF319F|nr:nucleoside-diphosphate kinase [Dactylosporangium sp. AC04546]WVK78876.1 nucleoside-diphosphate kinase [Dactylosporangium sp. AC04546]
MSAEPAAAAPASTDQRSARTVSWADWTVVLLKPDCVRRGLVEPVLAWVEEAVRLVDVRRVKPSTEQVFAHYDDMLLLSEELGRNVPAELRRIFVGQTVVIALGHGPDATARVRAMVGPTDPAAAPASTVRGRFAKDSLRRAVAAGRLVDNLIHTSDHAGVVERDFGIWYGPNLAHLLHPEPAPIPNPAGGTP